MDFAQDSVQNQEDSGVMEASTTEINPNSLYTPILKPSNSRKRKLPHFQVPLSNNASPYELDSAPHNPNILSSTLNDSITSKLEHCNINSSLTAETSPPPEDYKTEPSTPSKHFPSNYKMSPKQSPKLGSPERTQILYPKLHPTSKKRYNDFKRGSPAKKQLFSGPLRRDPVNFFLRDKACGHIVKKIFKALPDRDLYACSRVSKRWKHVVMELDGERLKSFRSERIVNKENYSASPNTNWRDCVMMKQSTPIPRENAIFELTNSLTEGQHLQHCPGCNNPSAVVQLQISQCSRDQCGYITCLKCGSFSTTGPNDFIDACENAMLLCADKPAPRKRPSLLDSPRKCPQDSLIPSFLQDDSHTINSSGYATESDLSANNSRSFLKDRSHVLKNCNADLSGGRRSHDRRSSPIVPVVPLNVKKSEPVYEPSSPPKVKTYAVGSKRSKKALRRL